MYLQTCCPYWRENQSFKTYGRFTIADISSVTQDQFTIGTICLKDAKNVRFTSSEEILN